MFCDNVTAVAYLCKEGSTWSALNTIAQEILRWAGSLRIRLAPQFIPGIRNVLADSLSRPHQLQVVSEHGRISIFDTSVAGDDRPICHLRQSSLLHLFLALPRLFRRGRTRSSSPGTVSWHTLFRRGPFFPGCWRSFVDLLQLSVDPPVTLSVRPDLLFQPRSRRRYPGLHRLALNAWRLSSDSPGQLVSPRR